MSKGSIGIIRKIEFSKVINDFAEYFFIYTARMAKAVP